MIERRAGLLVLSLLALSLLIATIPGLMPDDADVADRASHDERAAVRGKRIYTQGRSARGTAITASVLGTEPVPASRYPCARCHGADGQGGWEGGIQIPALRWPRLRTPRAATDGRIPPRPPYTRETLGHAIRHGRDPTGRALAALMPRYGIGDRDLADLAAYLRRLGITHAPGTSARTIRVGVLLPSRGPAAAQSAAVRTLLERYVARIDADGGIYGRAIELVVHDAGATQEQAMAAAEALLDRDGGVLCFLANGGPGAAPRVQALLARRRVPSIGPLTFVPEVGARGSVFYLLGSLQAQARAAARHLARHRAADAVPAVLVTTAHPPARQMAAAFLDEAQRHGLPVTDGGVLAAPANNAESATRPLVARLRASGSRLLIIWGHTRAAQQLLDEAARQGWRPDVLASSVLLGGPIDMGDVTEGRLHLVAPPLAPGLSHTRPRRADFWPLAAADANADTGTGTGTAADANVDTGARDRAMQMAAFAAAEVLTAGLEMAGRELSRAALVDALERMRDFPTGVLPPITFDRVRRQGAPGALIIDHHDGRARTVTWQP